MIGFDKKVPPEIGRFNFVVITKSDTGEIDAMDPVEFMECPGANTDGEKYAEILFAERELGKAYGKDFSLNCFSNPRSVGVQGNKHSSFEH